MSMHSGRDRKHRGRDSASKTLQANPTNPDVPQQQMTQVNRAVTASGNQNKHRGDRRDTSKPYTNNARHASRGSNPRPDVSTRSR